MHLPDNSKLWVHIEATRLVATIIHICKVEDLPKLLSSTRALCDVTLSTTHTSVHLEMGNALLKLIEECPNVTRSQFVKVNTSTFSNSFHQLYKYSST